MPLPPRGTYSQVLLHNIRHNIRQVRQLIGPEVKLLLVVKADAYGHGMVAVSQLAQAEGVDWLGVGMAEEGLALRQAGIRLPILVFSPLSDQGMLTAAQQGITVPIASLHCLDTALQAARESGKPLQCHLKIDSGMSRVGLRSAEEVAQVLDAFAESPEVQLTGAFTHFADADNPDSSFTEGQLARFQALCAPLPEGLLLHAAATAGLIRYPESRLNMVRLGIGAYGYPPVPTTLDLRPSLRLTARVAHLKEIAAGDCVSYACSYRADRPTRVATLVIGYGDGYPRALSNKGRVLIRGVSCPIIGRVCMDQVMVDVSAQPAVQLGDEAVMLGSDGHQRIDADELAGHCNTISYEILLSPSARVPRYYIDQEEE